jgi:hypothetical protein
MCLDIQPDIEPVFDYPPGKERGWQFSSDRRKKYLAPFPEPMLKDNFLGPIIIASVA